jgi:lysophospholipase L1-like esterase
METLRAAGMVQGDLLTVPALRKYLPPDLRSKRPTYGVVSRSGGAVTLGDGTIWDKNGYLRLSHYEIEFAHGATLARNLVGKINQYTTTYRTQFTRLYSRPERFVERTIAKMNEWGSTPVIVLPPYHPTLLKTLKRYGWDARHRQVLDYFRKLQRSCDFVLLDMSTIDSFGGWQSGFYDGVHMNAGMMRQLLGRVLDKAGWALR